MKLTSHFLRGKTEKGLEREKKALIAALQELEKKYARKQLVKWDYEHQRDRMEGAVHIIGLVLSTARTSEEISEYAKEHRKGISEHKKEKLDLFMKKKHALDERFEHAKNKLTAAKNLGHEQKHFMELHSEILEAQHAMKSLVGEDAKDRLGATAIIGELEKNLHRQEIKEMYNKATLDLVDEFVIKVPEHIHEKPAPIRRVERRSRLAKL